MLVSQESVRSQRRYQHRSNRLIVAIDEAGYGPNLGPLSIAATAWVTPNQIDIDEWEEHLNGTFSFDVHSHSADRLPLGDSKQFFKAGGHSRRLAERTVESFAAVLKQETRPLESFLSQIDPDYRELADKTVWMADQRAEVKSDIDYEESSEIVDRVSVAVTTPIHFLGWTATIRNEAQFNELVVRRGNKASVLTHLSLFLADRLVDESLVSCSRQGIPLDEIVLIFDKHGGRNRYIPPILEQWPGGWPRCEVESTAESRYRGRLAGIDTTWRFCAKADRWPSVGLSSMLAKWIREQLMVRLNSFWRQHLPDLSPTAGYPLDAKRFAEQIAPVAERLGMARSQWWRQV